MVTVSDTEVLRCRMPLVPVMVNGNVPLVLLVVTVIVVEPDAVTVGGLKLALAPLGKPLTLKLTVPLNPPEGVTVTV